MFNISGARVAGSGGSSLSEPWVAPKRIAVLIRKNLLLIAGIPKNRVAPVE